MPVKRIDHGELKLDAKRTAQGFLRCDAAIARTGVQIYALPGGQERREYRPPDEVFHADALASAALAPMTLGHPPVPVTAANVRQYQVGVVGPEAKADGKLVRTSALVMDAEAISAAETGRAAQLSCGYECELDHTPGVSPDGERYDAVQRGIRINHVALVQAGRAGPQVRLRLDSKDNAVQDDLPADHREDGGRTMKIKINGVEVEVPDTAGQLIEQKIKADSDALAAATAEVEKQKARADSAEAAKVKAEKERADAEDPKRLDAIVAARVELVTKARSVLGKDAKTDGMDAAAIKREVLAKLFPEMKLDGKSADYVDAAFDYAMADHEKKNPAARAVAGVLDPTHKADEAPADPRIAFMRGELERARKMGQSPA